MRKRTGQKIRTIGICFAIVSLLLVTACRSKTVPQRYHDALRGGNYSEAEGIYAGTTNTSLRESLDRTYSLYLLDLRIQLNEQQLTVDDYTTKLNQIANFKLSDRSEYLDAAVEIQNERTDSSEFIGQARNAAQLSDWPEAMRLLREAKAYAMVTESVRDLYATVRANYKQDIVARVTTLESKGNLEAAYKLLGEAIEFIPNDNDLAVELQRINLLMLTNEQTTLFQNVQNLRAEGAWQASLDALNTASPVVQQMPEVMALKEQLERSYEDSLLTALDKLEEEGDHVAALEQVERDLEIFPESLRLLWKQRVYEAIVEQEAIVPGRAPYADD